VYIIGVGREEGGMGRGRVAGGWMRKEIGCEGEAGEDGGIGKRAEEGRGRRVSRWEEV